MQSHHAQPLGSFLRELFEHTFPSPYLSTKPKDVNPSWAPSFLPTRPKAMPLTAPPPTQCYVTFTSSVP